MMIWKHFLYICPFVLVDSHHKRPVMETLDAVFIFNMDKLLASEMRRYVVPLCWELAILRKKNKKTSAIELNEHYVFVENTPKM